MSQNRDFDKKLLQFISFLTRNQKLMDAQEISKSFEINGKKVCERTVKRWFRSLQRNADYFDYYAVPRYERFGLAYCHILINGLKNMDIVRIIPYNTFFLCGTRIETSEPSTLLAYFVPPANLKDFESFWQTAKKLGQLKSYEIFTARDTIYHYSKFHETFNNGISDFSKEDDGYFSNILQAALRKDNVVEMHKSIQDNPLIALIALERFRETWSSTRIWNSAKCKLNEALWDYIKDLKTRTRRKDNSGIKLVQRTSNYINSNFDSFFRQVKVDYAPLFSHKYNLFAYLLVDIAPKELPDFVRMLHKNSLQCAVFLPHEKTSRHMFFTLTDFSGLKHITHALGSYRNSRKAMLWADHEATQKFWTRDFMKFDYAKVFDPKNCKWIYEHDKYMEQLKSTAQQSALTNLK